MCRHSINFIILVGKTLTTGTSINYDEKNEDLKITEEPKKTDEMPGKLIVPRKSKMSLGKFMDTYFLLVNFSLMVAFNIICYDWVYE